MIEAMDAAAGSMAGDAARLNAIAMNLANATTTAYKRELPSAQAFAGALRAAGEGEAAVQTAIDHRPGTLRFTGNALDLALDGDGYFEIQTDAGTAYTRQGDFHVDALGRLVTQAGHPVQGADGPIQLRNGSPTIDRDGRISDGETALGQLKVVRFDKKSELQRAGEGLFLAAAAPTPVTDGGVRIRQAHLEASNVNTASEMVKLMETMRHFEATQKIVQGSDDMLERALRKLGEF